MSEVWLNGVCITASEVLTYTLVSKTRPEEWLALCETAAVRGLIGSRPPGSNPAGLAFRYQKKAD